MGDMHYFQANRSYKHPAGRWGVFFIATPGVLTCPIMCFSAVFLIFNSRAAILSC